MTENKRFEKENGKYSDWIYDDGMLIFKAITDKNTKFENGKEIIDLLNELYEENKKLECEKETLELHLRMMNDMARPITLKHQSMIKTLDAMIENERTNLAKNALIQYKEAIRDEI